MRDTDWLESTDDPPDTRRARPLLLVLASVPWLVVIGLLVLPGRVGTGAPTSAPSATPRAEATGEEQASITEPGPSDDAAADAAPDIAAPDIAAPESTDTDIEVESSDASGEMIALDGRELRGRWRVEPGPEEAVALAVVAGRAWLTGVEPVLDLELDQGAVTDRGYAEHLIVEAVEHPASDALVVTLVAVMLDTDGGSPTVRRLAVPVAMTPEGARLAGAPWDLPPPVLDRITMAREATTDAGDLDAARAALLAAGLTEHDLVALHHTGGWPVIAEVATPGVDLTREIWLRRHLDGFVVAGTTLAGTTPPRGASAATAPEADDPDPDDPDPDDPDPDDPDPDDPDPAEARS